MGQNLDDPAADKEVQDKHMIKQDTCRDPAYGAVAKSLHWLIVALLAAQYAIAWTMPGIHRGTKPVGLIDLHLSLGITILGLAVLRLLWRLANPVPLLRDDMPPWQHRVAQATHALLYLLILVLPLMGWANGLSRGWTINVFGVAPLPPIMPAGAAFVHACGSLHILTSYLLLALVGLHVAAALYHHVVLGDGVLLRMLPSRR